jgi:site-specific recombinase XerD
VAKIRSRVKCTVDPAVQLEEYFAEFIRYSKAKNLSPVTILNYQKEFKSFHHFYNCNIKDISENTIIQYIEHLQKRNIIFLFEF